MPHPKGYVLTKEEKERAKAADKRYRDKNRITHCPKGHEYNEENTAISARGYRVCKICALNRVHKYRNNLTYEEAWKMIETVKNWSSENHDKIYDKSIMSRLRRYGITPEKYDEMYNKQDGKCAICGIHQSDLGRPLHIDHNHVTSEIRDLLCQKCNSGIGFFKDNIEIIEKAINYLRRHNQKKLIKDINLN